MAFQWSDNLSVGVDKIDQQHKELISRVNQLLEAMRAGKGKQEIDRVIAFMESYVVEHFKDEEKLMRDAMYPSIASQRLEHNQFVKDFQRLKHELQSAEITSTCVMQTQRCVCDWLVRHIGVSDRKFGEFTRSGAARKVA